MLADRNATSITPNAMPIPTASGNGTVQISRTASDRRMVVATIVADTAIPYPAASACELPKPIARPSVPIISSQFTAGR